MTLQPATPCKDPRLIMFHMHHQEARIPESALQRNAVSSAASTGGTSQRIQVNVITPHYKHFIYISKLLQSIFVVINKNSTSYYAIVGYSIFITRIQGFYSATPETCNGAFYLDILKFRLFVYLFRGRFSLPWKAVSVRDALNSVIAMGCRHLGPI